MKKFSVLLAASIMMLSFGFTNAQKLGHVDVAEILKIMPEKIKADEQLSTYANTKKAEIQKQYTNAEATAKRYQEEAPKQTQAVNEARSKEIQKLQQTIQELTSAAEKDLAQRQEVAFAPIEKKFMDAVSKVAKEKGFDYIFDTNTTTFIYKGGPDVTADVKKSMGL